MIAQRFRSLGWVAGVATAATGLYLISLQVAVERGKLDAVEREISAAQREMRQLQTELGTRASLRQLERWNGEVLALSAPKAVQYLAAEAQLASLDTGAVGDAPNAPPAMMTASLTVAPKIEPATLQQATYAKPVEAPKVQRVAMLAPAALGELARAAVEERRPRP